MKEIYQLLSSAMNQEMRMTQISNNLANINTPGFKRDDMAFQNTLDFTLAGQLPDQIVDGTVNPADLGWTEYVNSFTDWRDGDLQQTGNPLDVAINGKGFFTVRGDNGETWYTRAGNFKLNERNELTTQSGRQVLDANQNPITIDMTRGKPDILPDGTIRVGRANAGRIAVVEFADPQQLTKYGEGALFQAPLGVAAQASARPGVQQGMLERSNVNAIDEMVRMIQTERTYQATQKLMQTVDELVARRLEATRA